MMTDELNIKVWSWDSDLYWEEYISDGDGKSHSADAAAFSYRVGIVRPAMEDACCLVLEAV
jgi:hypothetical protein